MKMTLWALFQVDTDGCTYECQRFLGVFSTEDLAWEYVLKRFKPSDDDLAEYYTVEVDLDKGTMLSLNPATVE